MGNQARIFEVLAHCDNPGKVDEWKIENILILTRYSNLVCFPLAVLVFLLLWHLPMHCAALRLLKPLTVLCILIKLLLVTRRIDA